MPTLNSSSPQTEGIKEIRTTQDPLLRRRFLGGMLLSGMGMVGGCSQFAFGKDELAATANRCSDDAEECLETMLPDNQHEHETVSSTKPKPKFRFLKGELAYANFIADLNLRHLKPHEVLRPHRNVTAGVKNSLPPQSMWAEMATTLRAADEIREQLGKKLVYVNSAYRSPEYNAAVSGAKRSQHMQNCALDIVFECGTDGAVDMAKKLRSKGIFKGGIGAYPNFIHIDTRGENATWEA